MTRNFSEAVAKLCRNQGSGGGFPKRFVKNCGTVPPPERSGGGGGYCERSERQIVGLCRRRRRRQNQRKGMIEPEFVRPTDGNVNHKLHELPCLCGCSRHNRFL